MKIAITGKGGTGKTTVAGILAHCFKDSGYDVLAVDADPNANLASAIGLPPERASQIKPLNEIIGSTLKTEFQRIYKALLS